MIAASRNSRQIWRVIAKQCGWMEIPGCWKQCYRHRAIQCHKQRLIRLLRYFLTSAISSTDGALTNCCSC